MIRVESGGGGKITSCKLNGLGSPLVPIGLSVEVASSQELYVA